MKRRKIKTDDSSYEDDFFGSLDYVVIRFIIYFSLNLGVYFTGKFSWWIGFIFCVILSVIVLFEALMVGVAVLFGTVMTIFIIVTNSYLWLKNRSLKYEEGFFLYGFAIILINGLFSLSLFGLTYWLYLSFFRS